jgi:hypothetical protein
VLNPARFFVSKAQPPSPREPGNPLPGRTGRTLSHRIQVYQP